MSDVHTWIIEIHTRHGNPDDLVALFPEREYQIDWVNPQTGVVENYQAGTEFNCHHTSIFARRN
jgi:hypothetical protein